MDKENTILVGHLSGPWKTPVVTLVVSVDLWVDWITSLSEQDAQLWRKWMYLPYNVGRGTGRLKWQYSFCSGSVFFSQLPFGTWISMHFCFYKTLIKYRNKQTFSRNSLPRKWFSVIRDTKNNLRPMMF